MSLTSRLNIDSLKFFTGDGRQIIMQKQYSVEWEIIPADCIYSAFLKNPKGHFETDLSEDITSSVISTLKYDAVNRLYMTGYVNFDDYTLYTADLPQSTKILFYDGTQKEISDLEDEVISDGEFKFAKQDGTDAVYFRFAFTSENPAQDYPTLYVSRQTSIISFVVDEPGQIQPNVSFVRKSLDADGADFLYNYKLSATEDNISYVRDNDSLYNVLPKSGSGKEYKLDNIYDIIFFDYQYAVNSKSAWNSMSNTIRIMVNDTVNVVSAEYPLRDFFSSTPDRIKDDLNVQKYVCNSLSEEQSDKPYYIYGVTADLFTLVTVNDSRTDFDDNERFSAGQQTSGFYILNNNIDESQFPYMKYIGSMWQEKVSADFIASDTIIIVNDEAVHNEVVAGMQRYTYPKIDSFDSEYRFHFRFPAESEMFFITSDTAGEINKMSEYYTLTHAEKLQIAQNRVPGTNALEDQCMYFTVGFTTSEEGCYKNTLGIFLRDDETGRDFFVGAIQIMTEVEDEDERYRTLFGNFGIPDPIKYPNVFKSQSPDEDGIDWKVVNEKSKELFLSYDQIFPYAGTYKSLFNAMKFLGYQDVIFKEWYKIKDTNDQDRYIAVQNYNTETQKSLPSLLKKYGVEFGEYDRYTKLNRLSMIYHLQQIDYESSEEDLPMYNGSGIKVDVAFKDKAYNHTEIPELVDIYEYRADEVLAKLFSVKQWLERYITGVNCYISDITGEYIVVERLKTVGYVTEYEFKDFTKTGHFTPKCKQKTEFKDSSAVISCSLNEFNSLTFEDLNDYVISDFIHKEYSVKTDKGNNVTVYDSAPLGAMTIGDEYQFGLTLDTNTGSLYEFTDEKSKNNPILVTDNRVLFWNQLLNRSDIDYNELPIIQIKKGNIRTSAGSWSARSVHNSNVVWSISMKNDLDTGLSYCIMKNIKTGDELRTKGYVNFSPLYSAEKDAKFFYSADNNWQVPLFFFSGYKVSNEYRGDVVSDRVSVHADAFFPNSYASQDLVIEIIEGSIKFRDRKDSGANDVQNKHCHGCEIVFSEKELTDGTREQQISLFYEYESDRVPIYDFLLDNKVSNNLNGKSLEDIFTGLEDAVVINDSVDIPVNRLGDYTVSVKAFDSYNNVYTNKSDKVCRISTKAPAIDVIINRDHSENTEDFYKDNVQWAEADTDAEKYMPYVQPVENFPEIVKEIKEPVFPINYKIYNDEHMDGDGDSVYYDSMSYALDTPESNDYMILTNMTEKAVVEKVIASSVFLKMKSSNLMKQNIFKNGGYVNICVFDDNLQKALFETKNPVQVTESVVDTAYLSPSGLSGEWKQTEHIEYMGRITVIDDGELLAYVTENMDMINADNNINLYVINANQCDIMTDVPVVNWIDSDSGERRAFIPIMYHTDEHNDGEITSVEENYSVDLMLREFPIDTMVKIRAYNDDKSGNMSIINECAYRVIDTSVRSYINEKNPGDSSVVCGYIIDGNVDFDFINGCHNINIYDNKVMPSVSRVADGIVNREVIADSDCDIYRTNDIKFVMKPVHDKAVQYFVRVDDAIERSYLYDKSGFFAIMTQVDYNPQQLLFNSYFDDSYAVNIFRYDPMSLHEIWNDVDSENYKETDKIKCDMFRFRNFPVTVYQNTEIFVKTDDDCEQFEGMKENECVKKWVWRVKALEDKSNWKNVDVKMNNLILFECCNDIMPLKPYMLGSQSIELYCYDRYGNCISNTGGGNINVISHDDSVAEELERISFLRTMS